MYVLLQSYYSTAFFWAKLMKCTVKEFKCNLLLFSRLSFFYRIVPPYHSVLLFEKGAFNRVQPSFGNRSAVPNLFLFAYPHAKKIKLTYPLVTLVSCFIGNLSVILKLAYPLRLFKYPWGYAYPGLGTAVLE